MQSVKIIPKFTCEEEKGMLHVTRRRRGSNQGMNLGKYPFFLFNIGKEPTDGF